MIGKTRFVRTAFEAAGKIVRGVGRDLGAEDRAFVTSLMQRVTEPGKVAGWIAPPEIGINNAPLDYEYVRLN